MFLISVKEKLFRVYQINTPNFCSNYFLKWSKQTLQKENQFIMFTQNFWLTRSMAQKWKSFKTSARIILKSKIKLWSNRLNHNLSIKHFLMAFIKDFLSMTKRMDMVNTRGHLNLWKEINMKVSGKITNWMISAHMFGQMVISMWVIGLITKGMVKVLITGLMVTFMLVNGKMTKEMAVAKILGPMAIFMRVNLKMIKKMVKAH